jgi:hypothetical protein
MAFNKDWRKAWREHLKGRAYSIVYWSTSFLAIPLSINFQKQGWKHIGRQPTVRAERGHAALNMFEGPAAPNTEHSFPPRACSVLTSCNPKKARKMTEGFWRYHDRGSCSLYMCAAQPTNKYGYFACANDRQIVAIFDILDWIWRLFQATIWCGDWIFMYIYV